MSVLPHLERRARDASTAASPRERSSQAPRSRAPRVVDAPVFPVVGIGASATGLQALGAFVAGLSPGSGLAYVVVCCQLDAAGEAALVERLQRETSLPVCWVSDGMGLTPDCVHLAPPDRDLFLLNGVLHLLESAAPTGHRYPIDYFFSSLAQERQQRSIGVLLCGTGNDGTRGLQAIRDQAGLAVMELPEAFQTDGLSGAPGTQGLADIVAPVDQLPIRIGNCVRHLLRGVPPDLALTDPGEAGLSQVLQVLRQHTGHDFSLYKRNTLYRRIERRLSLRRLSSLREYIALLANSKAESELLFKEFLIGVTRFFRDAEVWDQLRDTVVPALLAARPEGGHLRAWSPGCSTGEEVYSLAMTFKEALDRVRPDTPFSLQIFATDLDQRAIAKARRGIYPATIATDVSAERLGRFFTPDPQGYRVRPEIREMVIFAPHNLLADPPFTQLDLLTCRNLLIYLEPDVHETLLPIFHYSLKPDGLLMLGSSESIGAATNFFAPLDARHQLYRRQDAPVTKHWVEFSTGGMPVMPVESPTRSVPAMKPTSAANLQSLADQLLLQRYAPAAVLVNAHGDILHISGKTGKYLEPAEGKANWNILVMAREGLSPALSEAFHEAVRLKETVTLTGEQLAADGQPQWVEITVQPLSEPAALQGMLMVVLADVPVTVAMQAPASVIRADRQSARLKELEQALRQCRDELQTTREEMQTSREELTSTNEELQSTNEELTTSTEELRTMNEELVRARSAAEAGLMRYTDLFDSAPVGYFTLERNGSIARVNLAGAELLGLQRDRLVGGAFRLFVTEADRPQFNACLSSAFATRETQLCEVALWRESEAARHVRVSALASEDGQTCRVVVADVTELRAAELEVARLAVVAQQTGAAVMVTDAQGRIEWVNPAFTAMTGFDAEEARGLRPGEVKAGPGTSRAVLEQMRLALDEKMPFDVEVLNYHRSGHPYWAHLRVNPVYDQAGRVSQFVGVQTDVTDRKRSEEQLATYTELLRRTSQLAKVGGWELDLSTQALVWSEEVYRIHDMAPDAPMDLTGAIRFCAPEARPAMEAALRAGMSSGTPWDLEMPLFTAKGRRIWVRAIGSAVVQNGKILRLVGALQDITERKQADELLQLMHTSMETASDALFWIKPDATIVHVNEAACRSLGYTREELLQLTIPDIDMQCEASAWARRFTALHHRGSMTFESLHRTRSGELIPVEIVANHVVFGSEERCCAFVRDITERRRIQESLRQSEERLRLILRGSNDAPWDWNLLSKEKFYSARWWEMLGYTVDELPADAGLWERIMHPDDSAHVAEVLGHALERGGESYEMEFRLHHKDGHYVPVLSRGFILRDEAGKPIRISGVNTDLSERKQAELDRRALEAQLRESQKMESIGTLAGGIAHDFNNILGSILGNVSLARHDVGDGHAALAGLEQIQKAGLRARDLVQQILTFSRNQPQELVNLLLHPLMEETLAMLRATLPARVSLDVSLSDAPLCVSADATQIQQVLMNLCTNAWHALQGSTGHITVGLEELTLPVDDGPRPGNLPSGRYAHLWVADTGSGMDPVMRTRIFEPFFTTKPVGQGTGLGLSVVHGIVAAHHGAITVDSAVGQGSTFHLYFPVVPELPPVAAASQPDGKPAERRSGNGEHVLYVDDDEVMVLMVDRLLQHAGYRVTCFQDAAAAIEAVRTQPASFDLVVTDFNMPELSGLEVAQALRHIRSDLPVVVSSGYISDELRTGAQRLGVRSLLHKQNTFEDLSDLVYRVLRGKA